MNPAGTIPVIVDDDGPDGARITLTQSAAILLYICQKAGVLMPNRDQFPAAWQWAFFIASDIAVTNSAVFLLEHDVPHINQQNSDFFRNRLSIFLKRIDDHLANHEYILSEFSFVDLMLYPNVALLEPLLISLGMASLARWRARLAARPGIRNAWQALRGNGDPLEHAIEQDGA